MVLVTGQPAITPGFVGEVLEGAAKPVGGGAEGVVQLIDQRDADVTVMRAAPRRSTTRRPSKSTTQ